MDRAVVTRFALPVNTVATFLGWPIPLIPTYFGWALYSAPAGQGSDRLPPTTVTADGRYYRDLRDSSGTWRNPDGTPVSPEIQAQFDRDWQIARQEFQRIMDEQYPKPLPFPVFPQTPSIPETVDTTTTSAIRWFRRSDPLVLDLDGDGIELTQGASSNHSVLFDHNADGLRTGTQWVGADDGLLVRDLNGNGIIDSGRELFGDQTQIGSASQYSGNPNQPLLAYNGFEALRVLDCNQDSLINAQDNIYAQLKIWQDANQDGISQAAELKTLAERGITQIDLGKMVDTGQGKNNYKNNSCSRIFCERKTLKRHSKTAQNSRLRACKTAKTASKDSKVL